MMTYKQASSVLVLIHTPQMDVLLLERHGFANGWQSVTGSREQCEDLRQTAVREVAEETGIRIGSPLAPDRQLRDLGLSTRYEIYERWRHRYAPGVTHNTEHLFSLCLPEPLAVRLAQGEHSRWQWLPWQEAARLVFSPSNAAAIRLLPALTGASDRS